MQHKLIAKKIGENLALQQQQLIIYLNLLETIKLDIEKKDADNLLMHLKHESEIIEQLNSIKKVLASLELLYKQSPYKKDSSLDELYLSVSNLSKQVTEKSFKNKNMIDKVVDKMRLDISAKPKLNFPKNSYTNPESRIIDIKL